MIKVGKLTATTTEQAEVLSAPPNATLIITSDVACQISINDNTHYQDYYGGEIIPLFDRVDTFTQIYYKTTSGTATIRYWVG